jgi:hypothetical protein
MLGDGHFEISARSESLGLGLNFNFFMVFPDCFRFYIGNLPLGSKFALVILGGTKRGKVVSIS